jgi:hypothetical protein
MKFFSFAKMAAVACIAALAAGSASACSCGASFHEPNNLEVATLEIDAASVILDCGAVYAPGVTYLILASLTSAKHLCFRNWSGLVYQERRSKRDQFMKFISLELEHEK